MTGNRQSFQMGNGTDESSNRHCEALYNISILLNIIRDNVTVAIDRGLKQIESVLMLKNSKEASSELRLRLSTLKSLYCMI